MNRNLTNEMGNFIQIRGSSDTSSNDNLFRSI